MPVHACSQTKDVENLLHILETPSLASDLDLRLSAAEQLCVVLCDQRFWPLLYSQRSVVDSVLSAVS